MSIKNRKKIVINVLVGLAIIFVALFFLIPNWIGHVDTKMQKTAFQIVYLQDWLNAFNRTHSRFPSTEQGLKLLTETIDDKGHPYLTRAPKDPRGNEYHYRSPGIRNKGTFDLWSYGSDNKLGGNEDHSRDITNWN